MTLMATFTVDSGVHAGMTTTLKSTAVDPVLTNTAVALTTMSMTQREALCKYLEERRSVCGLWFHF